MTQEERRIRFKVALDILNNLYIDVCHDTSSTKEECREFCDLLIDGQKYYEKLKNKK